LALIGGAQAEPFKANGEASGGDKLTACGQLISVVELNRFAVVLVFVL
jgi:hypothetical protein